MILVLARQHTIDTLKHQMSHGSTADLAEQITSGASILNMAGGRQPTLAECEVIIRRLQKINEQQQHEVQCQSLPFLEHLLYKPITVVRASTSSGISWLIFIVTRLTSYF